ncbi:unnamed protein product [Discula destructiva]
MVEELNAIDDQLRAQNRILSERLRLEGYDPNDDFFYNRFHFNLAKGLEASTNLKRRSVAGLRVRTEELAQSVRDNIENNKDRQEAAIYVFTIVTIIFLPISTVSGIFGINTSDVRNMEQSQWAFWAAVVPVTVVVVTASLFGAGVLSWRKTNGSLGTSGRKSRPAPVQAGVRRMTSSEVNLRMQL